MNRPRNNKAFTLIELLVAVTMIVAILSMVYATYFATSRSAKAYETRIACSARARRVLGQMARQIRCQYIPQDPNIAGDPVTIPNVHPVSSSRADAAAQNKIAATRNITRFFHSRPDLPNAEILSLVTTYPIPSGPDKRHGLFDVKYKFDRRNATLLASQRQFLGTPENENEVGPTSWQTLLENVDAVKMTFYDGSQWLQEWDFVQTKKPPRAVKIDVTLKDDRHQTYHYATAVHVASSESGQGATTMSGKLVSARTK